MQNRTQAVITNLFKITNDIDLMMLKLLDSILSKHKKNIDHASQINKLQTSLYIILGLLLCYLPPILRAANLGFIGLLGSVALAIAAAGFFYTGIYQLLLSFEITRQHLDFNTLYAFMYKGYVERLVEKLSQSQQLGAIVGVRDDKRKGEDSIVAKVLDDFNHQAAATCGVGAGEQFINAIEINHCEALLKQVFFYRLKNGSPMNEPAQINFIHYLEENKPHCVITLHNLGASLLDIKISQSAAIKEVANQMMAGSKEIISTTTNKFWGFLFSSNKPSQDSSTTVSEPRVGKGLSNR